MTYIKDSANYDKSVNGTVVFETDPVYNSGIFQSFMFDSNLLERGIFVRQDGKTFKVTRISNNKE
jgi:hypothetical protein